MLACGDAGVQQYTASKPSIYRISTLNTTQHTEHQRLAHQPLNSANANAAVTGHTLPLCVYVSVCVSVCVLPMGEE